MNPLNLKPILLQQHGLWGDRQYREPSHLARIPLPHSSAQLSETCIIHQQEAS
ncbi:hypothetical protein J6590_002843 [Homalodisca vitripennis]|nr:hypothetical protein J6590_002843 [Homalodisca vitripennis]